MIRTGYIFGMVLNLLWIGIASAQQPLTFTQIVDTPDQAVGAQQDPHQDGRNAQPPRLQGKNVVEQRVAHDAEPGGRAHDGNQPRGASQFWRVGQAFPRMQSRQVFRNQRTRSAMNRGYLCIEEREGR